jgi:hypothetical protein
MRNHAWTAWGTTSASCAMLGGLVAMAATSRADFSGPYAPDQWMFTPGPGGMLETHTADELSLIGGDAGFSGNTYMTVVAAATGMWTFDWSWHSNNNYSGFDTGYFLINGVSTFLSSSYIPTSGSISVKVHEGDVIGFRVETVTGIFGAGHLTITDFQGPVPTPAAAMLVAIPLLPSRRRRYDPRHGIGP